MTPVLSLCDRTGVMVRPWLEAGFGAVTVDAQEAVNPHPRRRHLVADVLCCPRTIAADLGSPMVFAFPPCTHLAGAGARWFREKGLSKLIDALRALVKATVAA